MILGRIKSLLEGCATDEAVFPATDLYNEGWMLRLVIDWLHRNRDSSNGLPITFPPDGAWYSEPLLPSAFLPRHRGDRLAESFTHADGVIGHFTIGEGGKGDLALRPQATAFAVVEAKMFSKLSAGVTNAGYFNQAARNVACMAEVLRRAEIRPDNMGLLSFHVMAPASQVDQGVFSQFMTRSSMVETVKRRVDEYEGERKIWYEDWFLPTVERADIRTVTWEDVVSEITLRDRDFGDGLADFYKRCLEFNRAARSV